jgi:hypothetical protein
VVEAAAKNGNEAIALAANLIKVSDRNLRLAAEYLAFAETDGKTQRQMAEGVGKSPAWVNGLLRWRRDGFQEDTPFGAQSQERDERHDEQIREEERLAWAIWEDHGKTASEHASEEQERRSGPKQKSSRQDKERRRAERERKESARIEAEVRARVADILGRRSGLNKQDRDTLVGALGMLGSAFDPEALSAARKAEAIRIRLGLTWDDLIMAAADEQRKAA